MSLTQVKTSNLDSTNGLFFRNRIINGDMQIDQRNVGALVSAASGYITDRWNMGKYTESTGVYSGQQVSDAPAGFTNSLRVTVTTAEASQGVNAYWQVFQHIEGFNAADLMFGTASAATVTVSFWVKCSVVGTYSVCLFNSGVGSVDRSYVGTYTINSANTWEYKTVTIPGDTTGGSSAWGKTNGNGISLFFDMGSGSGQQIAANTWTTANARRATGTTRLMATVGATWQVTGVQFEKGTAATDFEHRPFGTELLLCQRYYEKSFGYTITPGTATSSNPIDIGTIAYATSAARTPSIPFKVTKRANPTVTLFSPAGYGGLNINFFAVYDPPGGVGWVKYDGVASTHTNAFSIDGSGTGFSFTVGRSYLCAGEFTASAEL